MAMRSHLRRSLRTAANHLMPLAPLPSPPSNTSLQQCRSFMQMRTHLEVADNSGAKRVLCIKVLDGGKHGKLDDLIIASVKDAMLRGRVKKGEVVNCVTVRAAMQRQSSDGSEVRFDKNAVVIVNKQGEPVETRIFGPVSHELRAKNS